MRGSFGRAMLGRVRGKGAWMEPTEARVEVVSGMLAIDLSESDTKPSSRLPSKSPRLVKLPWAESGFKRRGLPGCEEREVDDTERPAGSCPRMFSESRLLNETEERSICASRAAKRSEAHESFRRRSTSLSRCLFERRRWEMRDDASSYERARSSVDWASDFICRGGCSAVVVQGVVQEGGWCKEFRGRLHMIGVVGGRLVRRGR